MNRLSFLIQKSSDRRLFAGFPRLIAGYHVFRRLSMPRHPPYTLSSLTTFIDHRQRKTTVSPASSKVGTNHHRQPRRLSVNPSGRAGTVAATDSKSPNPKWISLHPEPKPPKPTATLINNGSILFRQKGARRHLSFRPARQKNLKPKQADEDVANDSIRFTNLLIKP